LATYRLDFFFVFLDRIVLLAAEDFAIFFAFRRGDFLANFLDGFLAAFLSVFFGVAALATVLAVFLTDFGMRFVTAFLAFLATVFAADAAAFRPPLRQGLSFGR